MAEYNEAEQMELFREEGRKEGVSLFAELVRILLGEGLVDEVAKAASDKEYRNELFKRYGIFCE